MFFEAPEGKRVRTAEGVSIIFKGGLYETTDKDEIESLKKCKDVKEVKKSKPAK